MGLSEIFGQVPKPLYNLQWNGLSVAAAKLDVCLYKLKFNRLYLRMQYNFNYSYNFIWNVKHTKPNFTSPISIFNSLFKWQRPTKYRNNALLLTFFNMPNQFNYSFYK